MQPSDNPVTDSLQLIESPYGTLSLLFWSYLLESEDSILSLSIIDNLKYIPLVSTYDAVSWFSIFPDVSVIRFYSSSRLPDAKILRNSELIRAFKYEVQEHRKSGLSGDK